MGNSAKSIAKAYAQKGELGRAEEWYFRAVAEAPHLREPCLDLALLLYQREQWEGVLYFTHRALAIKERPRTYICEAQAWGSLPHDLRAIAFYHTGRRVEALEEAKKARALQPGDERLNQNVQVLEQSVTPAPQG